jgi:glyoxylase-like metal-dependent hydrolase (beta-lactamase superfamily II)
MKMFAAAVLAVVTGVVAVMGQGIPELEVLRLRPNFYLLAGAGGNVAVQVGEDGAVVVDAGTASGATAVVAAIKKLSPTPIRYVINTGPDLDHVGGNETVAKAGQTLFFQRSIGLPNDFLGAGAASILAVENVLTRMSRAAPGSQAFPVDAWPTQTEESANAFIEAVYQGLVKS